MVVPSSELSFVTSWVPWNAIVRIFLRLQLSQNCRRLDCALLSSSQHKPYRKHKLWNVTYVKWRLDSYPSIFAANFSTWMQFPSRIFSLVWLFHDGALNLCFSLWREKRSHVTSWTDLIWYCWLKIGGKMSFRGCQLPLRQLHVRRRQRGRLLVKNVFL